MICPNCGSSHSPNCPNCNLPDGSHFITCTKQGGTKDDKQKPRFSLLPHEPLKAVIRVLEFGAAKYGERNWEKVENWRQRYYDAAQRHLMAYWSGEEKDADSGESHLAHLICCSLFMMEMEESE